MDSSIGDFTKRFPIPATHIFLGNTGTPTRSILFSPIMKPGWDPGFHQLDAYKWKIHNAPFFNTTRPYTELSYMLASRSEQIIQVLHTQNIRPYWNLSFQYRLINAPGIFRNQRSNHNNYFFTSWYESKRKRYNNYFVFLNNKLQAGENGGIKTDKDYLNSVVYARDRFTVPTQLGGEPTFGSDLFSTNLYTGRQEKERALLMRQQYDFGRKDSLITDSVVIPLFYPKLRVEHSLKYVKHNYLFQDVRVTGGKQNNIPDSVYYKNNYGLAVPPNDSLIFRDTWSDISNDFSIYQFPDSKNLQQFIKLGMELQLLKGTFNSSSGSFYNLMAHGEYRNRTKNQLWDIIAFGKLFLNGLNSGDFHAYINLQRLLNKKLGSLQVGFETVNKSPSFIYNSQSSFYLQGPKDFKKENILHFFASILEPRFKLQLTADYFLMNQYLYIKNFYQLQQESSLFNVLRINAKKSFKISRFWNWHAELYMQQKAGNAELNLPLFYTRNRIAFEGNFFRNLHLSTGAEIRYHTPYKADHYSPVLGQFFFQDGVTISNIPDVAAFAHFRIRSFKAYVRAENLNTVSFKNGFFFNNNNLAAPNYPIPGLIFRLGINWSFVN